MGPWALLQAQALARQGHKISVVSPVPWLPRVLAHLPLEKGRLKHARTWAQCPHSYQWEGLPVLYPRWPVFHVGPQRRWTYRHPGLEALLGWWSLRRVLARIVETERPQVIYAHGTPQCGDLARRLRHRFGLPFVTVDHSLYEIADCAQHPARLAQYRRVAADAYASIAPSRRLEGDIQRLIKPHKTLTLHNAADPPPTELVEGGGTRDHRVVVFSAGAFVPSKGFPLLIDAFARATSGKDAVLRIAGNGPELPAVEEAIRRNGAVDRVELPGFLPHKAVLGEMARSDIFALVGWDELCATVCVEAMAAGKPIVYASDGGVDEILESGVHGLAVKPHDVGSAAEAIRRLIADAEERRRMGQEARALHRRRLTWDANARVLSDVLAGALAEARRSSATCAGASQ
jgi:glycosyltransferase involved in cell wall biosynthesis